jgi:rhodanese-related sulfurtransferase
MSFNSVERVVEFLEMDQEAPTITDVRPPSEVSSLELYLITLLLISFLM